jgi:hypothetical protein
MSPRMMLLLIVGFAWFLSLGWAYNAGQKTATDAFEAAERLGLVQMHQPPPTYYAPPPPTYYVQHQHCYYQQLPPPPPWNQ